MSIVRAARVVTLLLPSLVPVAAAAQAGNPTDVLPHMAGTLKVTILSTMLADNAGSLNTFGEWGFAALLESDGHQLLIDTGAHPETVVRNAEALNIKLCGVQDVVLTHYHRDHTSGLLTLRRACMTENPQAFSRAHVAPGIFWSRPNGASEGNQMIATRKDYLATGGVFVEHSGPAEIVPGVWVTGSIERKFPERNFASGCKVVTPAGLVEDNIPDDQSVFAVTPRGLVVITGCGHAGVVNIVTAVTAAMPRERLYALIGGLHLYSATDQTLDWTADRLKGFGVQYLVGAHCTGIESVYRLRTQIGLTRQTAVVGAVGASFVLGEGIHAGAIAQ